MEDDGKGLGLDPPKPCSPTRLWHGFPWAVFPECGWLGLAPRLDTDVVPRPLCVQKPWRSGGSFKRGPTLSPQRALPERWGPPTPGRGPPHQPWQPVPSAFPSTAPTPTPASWGQLRESWAGGTRLSARGRAPSTLPQRWGEGAARPPARRAGATQSGARQRRLSRRPSGGCRPCLRPAAGLGAGREARGVAPRAPTMEQPVPPPQEQPPPRPRSHTVTTTSSSFTANLSASSSTLAYDREFLRTLPGLLMVTEIVSDPGRASGRPEGAGPGCESGGAGRGGDSVRSSPARHRALLRFFGSPQWKVPSAVWRLGCSPPPSSPGSSPNGVSGASGKRLGGVPAGRWSGGKGRLGNGGAAGEGRGEAATPPPRGKLSTNAKVIEGTCGLWSPAVSAVSSPLVAEGEVLADRELIFGGFSLTTLTVYASYFIAHW